MVKNLRIVAIFARPSVFGPRPFNVPTRGSGNQNWRQDFNSKNEGNFYRIWNEDGRSVQINRYRLRRRCLSRAERVILPENINFTSNGRL